MDIIEVTTLDQFDTLDFAAVYTLPNRPQLYFVHDGPGPRGGGDALYRDVETALQESERAKNRKAANDAYRAKMRAEEEKENQIETDFLNSFNGFLDQFSAMERGRKLKTLKINVIYRGAIISRKCLVELLVERGYVTKNNSQLIRSDGYILDVTKTEVEYANYILSNN